MTFDTVPTDTPAFAATSAIVGLLRSVTGASAGMSAPN
jgi:hypothetical protein